MTKLEEMLNVSRAEISILENTYIKEYHSKTKVCVFNRPREVLKDGYEPNGVKRVPNQRLPATSSSSTSPRSLRRTKTILSDIVLANDFEYFVTFTFAKEREDVNRAKSKMSVWFKNQRLLGNNLQYIVVPEFHKDGKSLHFHALINGNLKLIPTKIYKNGRLIYNLKNYKSGYSTAVKIDNQDAVSSYIKKYITKDMPQFKGQKKYWCSKNLLRPRKASALIDRNHKIHKLEKVYENQYFTLYETTDSINDLL